MQNIMDSLGLIQRAQKTIDVLLREKVIVTKDNAEPEDYLKRWVIQTIIQNENCTVGFAFCANPDAGDFPDHIHENSVEYLICTSGSFLAYFNSTGLRIVKVGECLSVPKGVIHRTKALEINTAYLWICVPADKQMENLPRETLAEKSNG
jgi:quercetin dioxygenase-like cupin family protein